MSTESKQRLLITAGDPGGIGLEVTFKSLLTIAQWSFIPIIIVSKPQFSHDFYALFKTQLTIKELNSYTEIPRICESRTVYVLFTSSTDSFEISEHAKPNGHHAYDCIQLAVNCIKNGYADTIVTAPISKLAFKWAGYKHTGHTTCLAALTKTEFVSMAFASPELNVILHTIHIPLEEVPKYINPTRLRKTVDASIKFGYMCGYKKPKIAIASLNPHAGERGKLGFEDTEIISPLVKEYQAQGQHISGPHPADTVFWYARQNQFDVVVSMYHDQGLIPIKTLAFDKAVNVTIGLPFVRTSPDHGTAFDIAYQNKANPSSMIEAILFAAKAYETTK